MRKYKYFCFKCQENGAEVTRMCKHLEGLMPHESQQSVKAFPVANPDLFRAREEDSRSQPEKELEFLEKLYDYGIDDVASRLLCLKFVYNFSLTEIADYLHLDSPRHAFALYRDTLALLKERGYRG